MFASSSLGITVTPMSRLPLYTHTLSRPTCGSFLLEAFVDLVYQLSLKMFVILTYSWIESK